MDTQTGEIRLLLVGISQVISRDGKQMLIGGESLTPSKQFAQGEWRMVWRLVDLESLKSEPVELHGLNGLSHLGRQSCHQPLQVQAAFDLAAAIRSR